MSGLLDPAQRALLTLSSSSSPPPPEKTIRHQLAAIATERILQDGLRFYKQWLLAKSSKVNKQTSLAGVDRAALEPVLISQKAEAIFNFDLRRTDDAAKRKVVILILNNLSGMHIVSVDAGDGRFLPFMSLSVRLFYGSMKLLCSCSKSLLLTFTALLMAA